MNVNLGGIEVCMAKPLLQLKGGDAFLGFVGCKGMPKGVTAGTPRDAGTFCVSWLRVSGTAEMPQIDQCVGHQFHTVVSLLFELKAQQQPLEFVLPREGPLHA